MILIGIGATYWFQRREIKALKTEVQANKDIIEGMKSFMSIFKVDELEKYVAVKEQRVRLETQQEIQKQRREYVIFLNKLLNQLANKFGQDTADLLKFCTALLTFVEPKYREGIIKDGVPNEHTRNSLLEIHRAMGDAWIDDGFLQHDFVKALNGKPSMIGNVSDTQK